jgi:hypothetical protein
MNFIERIAHGIHLFKLACWTVFALFGPVLFTLMHNFLGVFVLGLISGAIGYFIFRPATINFRGSALLRKVLIAQGLIFTLYGGYVLFSPASPWTHAYGGRRTSLALTPDGTVYGVEFTEKSAGFIRFDPKAQKWSREIFPGRFVTDIFFQENGKLIAPEDRSRRVWYYESGKWLMRSEAVKLRRQAVDCKNTGQTPFVPEQCAKASDGKNWIALSKVFWGKLAIQNATNGYDVLDLPAPRIEALYLNPTNTHEAWAAFWGSGVYRTLDRGATWKLMGLKGSEVTSIAVDFQRKLAYASTGSGIFQLQL